MEKYPVLGFIVRWGGACAAALALIAGAAAAVALFPAWGPAALVAGVVAGGVVFGLARSYVELVRLIVDLLLPQ